MRRYYLVNLQNLVYGISVSALVVKRLERLRNLTYFKRLDGSIILRLELVYLKL